LRETDGLNLKPKIAQHIYGWYATIWFDGLFPLYLHKDGLWRISILKDNVYNIYFVSKEKLEIALLESGVC